MVRYTNIKRGKRYLFNAIIRGDHMRDWFTVLGKIFGFVFFIMCLYVGAFMLMAVAHVILNGIV